MRRLLLLPLAALAACGGSQPGRVTPPASQSRPDNRKPVIQEITTSPTFIAPGAEATSRAVASDPDFDSLVYDWEMEGGVILEGGNGPIVRWRAAETAEQVVLTLQVKDREAFAEATEEIALAQGRLLLETTPPAKAEKGAPYTAHMRTLGLEEIGGGAFQFLYAPAQLALEEVVLEGLTRPEQEGWSVFVHEPSKGRVIVLILPHAGATRAGGTVLRLSFSLLGEEMPAADAVSFGHQGLEVGLVDAAGKVVPAALVDPREEP